MSETQDTARRPRRLRRSRDDRMIAGVAGGIGEYFAIDPVLVRIGFVALALIGGVGLIVYPIAWLFVPDADGSHRGAREMLRALAVVGGVLLLCTGLFLAAAAAAGLGGGTAVAIAVLVAGVVLFVAAFGGRRLRWLILPAFAAAIGATAIAAADVDLHGGVKDDEIRPAEVAAVGRHYEVGIGRLALDLSGVRFPAGDTRVSARVGMGELQVIVPDGVCVATDSHVSAGAVTWFGHETGGSDLDVVTRVARRGKPRLVIRADVGFGHLEITDTRSDLFPRRSGDACEEVKAVARPH